MLKMDLKTFINMAVADTTTFTVPMDNNHPHDFTLTAEQIMTLKNGGTVTGIVTIKPNPNMGHTHTYTISCMP